MPQIPVTIADCGELPADYQVSEVNGPDAYGDAYEDFPEDAKTDDKEFTAAEIVQIASEVKGFGTKAFKEGQLDMGVKKYRKALGYLNEDPETETASKEDTEELRKLRYSLNSNIALLSAKLGKHDDAIKHAGFALDVEGISEKEKAKALYRRAIAKAATKDEESALEDLAVADKLVPGDGLVEQEIKRLKAKTAERLAREKKVYAKAFDF